MFTIVLLLFGLGIMLLLSVIPYRIADRLRLTPVASQPLVRRLGNWLILIVVLVIAYYVSLYLLFTAAVTGNHVGAARVALALGANPDATTLFSGPVLNVAIRNGNYELTKLLVDCGANPEAMTGLPPGFPLQYAAEANRLDMVTLLIDAGADVNQVSLGTALSYAAWRADGDTRIMEVLIAAGADVNKTHPQIKETALMMACRQKNVAGIIMLLQHNVLLDVQDWSGHTALLNAASANMTEGVQLLLAAGANPNIQDWDNWSPLYRALHWKNPVMLKILLRHGVDIDKRDGIEETALMKAVMYDYPEGVRLLLAAGANPGLQNRQGMTARDIAVASNRRSLVPLLTPIARARNHSGHEGRE